MSNQLSPTLLPELRAGPVICLRCQRPFSKFVFEEIKGILQLRCGDVIIPHIKANCMHCGWTFNHHVKDAEVEQLATIYRRILRSLPGYLPE